MKIASNFYIQCGLRRDSYILDKALVDSFKRSKESIFCYKRILNTSAVSTASSWKLPADYKLKYLTFQNKKN